MRGNEKSSSLKINSKKESTMKINSNTIKLERDSKEYQKMEKLLEKIASENKIENVEEITIKLAKDSGIVKYAVDVPQGAPDLGQGGGGDQGTDFGINPFGIGFGAGNQANQGEPDLGNVPSSQPSQGDIDSSWNTIVQGLQQMIMAGASLDYISTALDQLKSTGIPQMVQNLKGQQQQLMNQGSLGDIANKQVQQQQQQQQQAVAPAISQQRQPAPKPPSGSVPPTELQQLAQQRGMEQSQVGGYDAQGNIIDAQGNIIQRAQ